MACSIDLTWSGIGEGGSGSDKVDGSGGKLRILKENMIDPSANNEVSGKLEKALVISSAFMKDVHILLFPRSPSPANDSALNHRSPLQIKITDDHLLDPSPYFPCYLGRY